MIGCFPSCATRRSTWSATAANSSCRFRPRTSSTSGTTTSCNPAGNPLENLRPQVIYNALLLPEIDPKNEIAVLENSTEIIYDAKTKKNLEQPDYVIDIIHRTGNDWYSGAQDRIRPHQPGPPSADHLRPERVNVATEATYQVYQDYNGVSFPDVIEINRPQEEYSIRLTVEKLVINEQLRDDQFALTQPAARSWSTWTSPSQPGGLKHAASPTRGDDPTKK